MSWAKLDDRFHGNRKVRRAWKRNRASVGLYVLALTYAAQHETDGMVDAEFIDDAMPVTRERDAAVQTLVDTGLWEAEGDDYRIHDYLEYHQSAATAEAKRDAKARRQAQWREKQGRSASHDASTDASPDDSVDAPVPPPRPDPTDTQPFPTQPPLTPPAIAGGEQGSVGSASPQPNSRALGTSPRQVARRLAEAQTDERVSLAVAGLSEPGSEHRGEWSRLHTKLLGAVGENAVLAAYVEDLTLAAVDDGDFVIDGPDEAWGWATQRFRSVVASWANSLGLSARLASLDEHNGLALPAPSTEKAA